MSTGFYNVPKAKNEPVRTYAPGSADRTELQAKIKEMCSVETELPGQQNSCSACNCAACELADFYRFGVQCMADIYAMQPWSNPEMWNYNEFRALEGFVSGPDAADVVLSHPGFAGIHFTGSTAVFKGIWKIIG
jgi:hypothetical protein